MGDGRLTELRVAERDAERAIECFEPLFDGRLAHALLDLDRLTACVVPAVRADAVRELRLLALRARVVRRRFALPRRAALRGPRLALLLLGDGHRCVGSFLVVSRGRADRG